MYTARSRSIVRSCCFGVLIFDTTWSSNTATEFMVRSARRPSVSDKKFILFFYNVLYVTIRTLKRERRCWLWGEHQRKQTRMKKTASLSERTTTFVKLCKKKNSSLEKQTVSDSRISNSKGKWYQLVLRSHAVRSRSCCRAAVEKSQQLNIHFNL